MAEPILKWAGGKRQLLDELYARFPATYGRYHEPFVGGGAVFFDLEPTDATVNDANPRLVNFYERVRDEPEALIERLESFDDPDADPGPALPYAEETARDRDVESYYYQQRARFNRRPYEGEFDSLEEAALLLYLNRTCYNGLYRENADGGFNVPVGRYANPDWVQRDRIRRASDALTDATIRNDDFAYVLDAAEPGDLVYFDPLRADERDRELQRVQRRGVRPRRPAPAARRGGRARRGRRAGRPLEQRRDVRAVRGGGLLRRYRGRDPGDQQRRGEPRRGRSRSSRPTSPSERRADGQRDLAEF